MEAEAAKRQHRKAQAGAKFQKKQDKEKKKAGHDGHRHDPRAFTFSGGVVSVRRRVQRSAEMDQKRTTVEKIDKTPDIPPPYIIAVQGPPGVGKTTLIRSLVKHYSKHNISDVNGPITLVSGRNRRITFVECPNNMQQMIDVAKVADLVLLMIDGQFGFEMETFEFLNIMQVHGFPRVMGVLTHLDSFKDNKTLRKQKKKLKNRFWSEIYDGAKLFNLSGLQYGRYNKTEVANLSRFLAVQKFHGLTFRSAHPYILALRMEDQTHGEEDENAPRTISLYGYVKGARMREGQLIHIPGAGDFNVRQLDDYIDPCPAPSASMDPKKMKKSNETGSRLLRTLKDTQRGIYAPGCDVGNIQLDADAMYIHVPQHAIGFTRKEDVVLQGEDNSKNYRRKHEVPAAVKMVHSLQDAKGALARARAGNLTLLPGGAVVSEGHSSHPEEMKIREIHSDEEEEEDVDDDHEEDSDDSLLADDRKKAREEAEEGVRMPWKDRGAHNAADALDSDEDEDDEQEDSDDNEEEGDDDMEESEEDEEEDEEGQYEIESGAESGGEDEEEDVKDEEDDDAFEEDEDDEEEESDSDVDAVKSFMRRRASEASDEMGSSGLRALSLLPSLPSSSSKTLDIIYGRLRWKDADLSSALASRALTNPDNEKFTLFDDSDEELENKDAITIGQAGVTSGAAVTGLLGQVPKGHPAMDAMDCTKLQPAALLKESLPAARVAHLGAAGVMWRVTMGWDEFALEALKTKKFITGGWDGAEEEEEEVTEQKRKKEEEAEESDEDDDDEEEEGKSSLGWRKGQKELNARPDKDEDGNDLFYDDEGNLLEGIAAYAAKKKKEEEKRKANLAALNAVNDVSSKPIGAFVRVTIANVPAAWVRNYSLKRPVIIGGLLPGEGKLGMLQCKIKRHRWSPRVLKNQDPLLFSIGWRRFQSVPTYALEDRNQARIRMLKYTPEHMHCLATFYGPLHPPNTGILGVRQWGTGVHHFRVSMTGVCTAAAANFKVVKKLKLVGEPVSIMKHTAFIKNMFSSDLEVAKCIGARIETVSGIRGQVKKADGTKGNFRATFEDKILMSDIVMMKAWTAVEPKRFFNPVIDVEGAWRRIRTIAELRHVLQEPVMMKKDSEYTAKPERRATLKHDRHVKVPNSIMKNLPFDSRPKNAEKAPKKEGADREIDKAVNTLIKSEYEKRVETLMHRLETVRSDREKINKQKLDAKKAIREKEAGEVEERKALKRKELTKEHYRKKGKVEAAKRRKMRLGDE